MNGVPALHRSREKREPSRSTPAPPVPIRPVGTAPNREKR